MENATTMPVEHTQIVQTKRNNLLSFTGPRYSGKSLVTQFVKEISPKFQEINFADVAKQEYAALANIDVQELYTTGIKERHRWGLIEFCDKKKQDDPKYFINKFFQDLKEDVFYVCGDLRSIEELEATVRYGGIIYRVYSTKEARRERGWISNPEVDNHLTETDLLEVSAWTLYQLTKGGWIYNTSSDQHKLKGEVYQIMERHFPQ